jgi:hypothetical protein
MEVFTALNFYLDAVFATRYALRLARLPDVESPRAPRAELNLLKPFSENPIALRPDP